MKVASLLFITYLCTILMNKGQTSSSIGEEKKFNPRLRNSKADFVEIMKKLHLVYPRLMKVAVPANMICGLQYDGEQPEPEKTDK